MRTLNNQSLTSHQLKNICLNKDSKFSKWHQGKSVWKYLNKKKEGKLWQMSSPHAVETQVMTSDNKSKINHNFRGEILDYPVAFALELYRMWMEHFLFSCIWGHKSDSILSPRKHHIWHNGVKHPPKIHCLSLS